MPLPALATIPPARPAVDAPEPRNIAPAFPPAEVPVLKTSRPLAHADPALQLPTVNVPLLAAVPSPLVKHAPPPVPTILRPVERKTGPPEPLVPLPTVILRPPPRPTVATLDPKYNDPAFPATTDPELNASCPLAPASPEFADETNSVPLLDAVPSPVLIRVRPPLDDVLRPASSDSMPPDPLVPLPGVMLAAPARPPVATPEPIHTVPLFPVLLDPELNDIHPPVPPVPALALDTDTQPELVTTPSPPITRITPPERIEARPDEICSLPPEELVPLPTETKRTPAMPPLVAPEPRCTDPLFPLLLVPLEKTNVPLEPPWPPLMDRSKIFPLVEATASPAITAQ